MPRVGIGFFEGIFYFQYSFLNARMGNIVF
jgi:hypothetical protein